MSKESSFQKQRGMAVLIAAFAIVLLGGVAFAQIGTLGGGDGEPGEAPSLSSAEAEATPTTATATAVVAAERTTNPGEPPADTPPADKPPSDEPPTTKPPADPVKPPVDDDPPSEDTTPPEFVILRPEDGAHTEDSAVTVKGETEPGAEVFYGDYAADVDKDGNWRIRVSLAIGRNKLVFHATDEAGNTSEASITVFRDEVDKEHRFTAHQKWDVVDGEPVINKYYGTAEPGTKIWIASEFGGAETKADESGAWEAKVTFRETTCNTSWKVVVEAATNHRAEFRMKRVCPTDTKFTAHQKWDVVDGEPVVNKYYGTAAPGTKIWVASEFGGAETKANESGEWFVPVTFRDPPCHERFAVVVESNAGDRAEFTMKRVCPDEHTFTANQKYGSCGEAVPYDVFFGTAKPGVEIWVKSDFGNGSTVVGEDGKWRIRVEFPEAPVGKKFAVAVKSSAGDRADFWFTRTGDEK